MLHWYEQDTGGWGEGSDSGELEEPVWEAGQFQFKIQAYIEQALRMEFDGLWQGCHARFW